MQLHFPFILDGRGLVGEVSESGHIRQLIEQVLFTNPGERVNRPEFGCGLLRAVFDPGDEADLQVWQFVVQEGLERWLGDVIDTTGVEIQQRDTTLMVRVEYRERFSQQQRAPAYEVTVP